MIKYFLFQCSHKYQSCKKIKIEIEIYTNLHIYTVLLTIVKTQKNSIFEENIGGFRFKRIRSKTRISISSDKEDISSFSIL